MPCGCSDLCGLIILAKSRKMRPRIFVSSTFYDLKVVRGDIERFIGSFRYDPVLFERGHIPYVRKDELENACYKEIASCDIIISIIGHKYGSKSLTEDYSINQYELKTAIELGKQIYIFIESSVSHEFETYPRNKGKEYFIEYNYVDNVEIYEFIKEIKLFSGIVINSFNNVEELCDYLKEQWAGLFQKLLAKEAKWNEKSILDEMKKTSRSLKELVGYIMEERNNASEAFNQVIFANHPCSTQIAELTNTPYRVYFANFEEMNKWLQARNYKYEGADHSLSHNYTKKSTIRDSNIIEELTIFKEIFEEESGNLKTAGNMEWSKDFIKFDRQEIPFKPASDDLEDEIPF
jgi:hypothetical protein